MTFLRSNVAISSLGTLALAAVALLAGCSGDSDPGPGGEETCSGITPAGAFDLVEPKKSVSASCATFGSYGQPGQSGGYKHTVQLTLEGDVHLQLWFPHTLTAPTTLDFAAGGEFGAELVDYRGWEGAPRSLCATLAGFPPNAGTKGTIVIDSLTVGADGFLDGIKAKVDVSFAECSVDVWKVENLATLTVRGDI